MSIKRNHLVLNMVAKIPCRRFWFSKYLVSKYQTYLDELLASAMESFNYITFKMALCCGANPNIDAKILKGYHLVSRCARSDEPEFLETLLLFGGDVHGSRGNVFGGYQPIHMAATKGMTSSIDVLLRYGANLEAVYIPEDSLDTSPNRRGWTPLVCACIRNHTDTAIALLRAGANPFATDDNGTGLVRICNRHKNYQLATLIEKYQIEADLKLCPPPVAKTIKKNRI